jgi:hypothetical protein
MRRHFAAGIGACALALAPGARASVTTYTSQAAFAAAIAGLETVAALDFESLGAPTAIPSGAVHGGFAFTYSIAGEQLVVTDAFPATSGANSLGVTGDLVFLASDAFSLAFPPATAIGLYVIGEDMLPGDVELQTVAGTVENGEAEGVLSDGASVFFLGIVESEPGLAFGEATVASFAVEDVGDFVWNADDLVAAPEPGTGACTAAALATLLGVSRRRAGAPRPARSGFHRGR